MAFSSKGHTQTTLAEINITPLVDVVLVLLLIFMLTAPVLQSGVEVAIPKTRTVNQLTEERMVVTIDREQNVEIDDEFDFWLAEQVLKRRDALPSRQAMR